jgi:hypothetical protein
MKDALIMRQGTMTAEATGHVDSVLVGLRLISSVL